jgi:hypothetical protein
MIIGGDFGINMFYKILRRTQLDKKISEISKIEDHYAHMLGWVQKDIRKIDDLYRFGYGDAANRNDLVRWIDYAWYFIDEYDFYKAFITTKDYKHFNKAFDFLVSALAFEQGAVGGVKYDRFKLKKDSEIANLLFSNPYTFNRQNEKFFDGEIKKANTFITIAVKIIDKLDKEDL